MARIFNTYGPRMHPADGRVVSKFIVQALSDAPIKVNGDGSQKRSFCYVADLIKALMLLMDSPSSITGPINLGNPTEITIRELAELVRNETGSTSSIVTRPLLEDDAMQRQPDISLAKSQLGWEPSVPLSDGLRATIAYFRSANRLVGALTKP